MIFFFKIINNLKTLNNIMEHNFFITKIYDLLTSCEDADRSEKIIIIDEIFTCIANNIHLLEGEYGLINIIRSKLIHFYEDENW